MEKPFNPVLGETFQGRINGLPVYFEQIGHHPPICSYLMKGINFTLSGWYEPSISMSLNSLITYQKGKHLIEFPKTNSRVELTYPAF